MDSEVVNRPHPVAIAADPAGFAGVFPAERFISNLQIKRWRRILWLGSVVMVLHGHAQIGLGEEAITNPVALHGADPWVIRHSGFYYYCYSTAGNIWVNKAKKLQDAVQRKGESVWNAGVDQSFFPRRPTPSIGMWAPELHFLNGRWYIYFAADVDGSDHYRQYVLESKTTDALGSYVFKGKVATPDDHWAIDGTVLVYKGSLFFVWSGWEGSTKIQQNLYIAHMRNPTTIDGERVKISSPEYDWETFGTPRVNEAPEVLVDEEKDKVFIIYSASGSWTDKYCLGQLTLVGANPLNPNHWKKRESSVFFSTAEVVAPGHASFTQSPDGTEDWIVYHAARHSGAGWDRNVRIQRFTWDSQGNPCFGVPIAPGVPMAPPSDSEKKEGRRGGGTLLSRMANP